MSSDDEQPMRRKFFTVHQKYRCFFCKLVIDVQDIEPHMISCKKNLSAQQHLWFVQELRRLDAYEEFLEVMLGDGGFECGHCKNGEFFRIENVHRHLCMCKRSANAVKEEGTNSKAN